MKFFILINKIKKILNNHSFRIFYGAPRGIRTRVKTLAYVALLDAKTALLLGFSFPLKTFVFGDPDRGRGFSYEKNIPI